MTDDGPSSMPRSSPRVFSAGQRDRAHERIVEMAREDARVVAGAVVGSRANGGGDRWSDIDLTFALAPGVTALEVLGDWTRVLGKEFGAVHLFDLPFLSSLYRVFLFPGQLQVDVSFTPAAEFGALSPQWELLFGHALQRAFPPPPSPAHAFGVGAHHALRARFCIERRRFWQAEYWISGLRDQALTLACLRRGIEPRTARGFDELPAEVLARFAPALVAEPERDELLRALEQAIERLLEEAGAVGEARDHVAPELRALVAPGWPAD